MSEYRSRGDEPRDWSLPAMRKSSPGDKGMTVTEEGGV